MNRIWVVLTCLVVMLFACQEREEILSEKETAVITKRVTVLSENLYKHWNNRDMDKFLNLFVQSKGLTVMVNGKVTRSWKEHAKKAREGIASYKESVATMEDLQVEVVSSHLVLSSHSFTWYGVKNTGEKEKGEGKLALVYRKGNDGWKIIFWGEHLKKVLSEDTEGEE